MTDEERIVAAWDKAQDAFRAMLTAGVYGDPKAHLTQAYVDAERDLDAELERTWRNRHDPDCDCYHIARQQLEETMRAEAEGDHFAYPSAR